MVTLNDPPMPSNITLITQPISAKAKQGCGISPSAPKKRPGVRSLTTPADVTKLLGRLIKARLADDDTLSDETLRAVTQACACLLKSMEASTLDARLAEIEKKLNEYEAER